MIWLDNRVEYAGQTGPLDEAASRRLVELRDWLMAQVPGGGVLQLGFAHAEMEQAWLDAVVLQQGTLWRYQATADEREKQVVLKLENIRPYLLLPRRPELQSELAAFDAKEFHYRLLQVPGEAFRVVLQRREELSLFLSPVPPSGEVDFRQSVRLDPQFEQLLRQHPDALQQMAQGRAFNRTLLHVFVLHLFFGAVFGGLVTVGERGLTLLGVLLLALVLTTVYFRRHGFSWSDLSLVWLTGLAGFTLALQLTVWLRGSGT